eukprot:1891877-Rhodomonas_salina.2
MTEARDRAIASGEIGVAGPERCTALKEHSLSKALNTRRCSESQTLAGAAERWLKLERASTG